jgi:hypothetical protein
LCSYYLPQYNHSCSYGFQQYSHHVRMTYNNAVIPVLCNLHQYSHLCSYYLPQYNHSCSYGLQKYCRSCVYDL